jgi:hypothetical protein
LKTENRYQREGKRSTIPIGTIHSTSHSVGSGAAEPVRVTSG